MSLRCNSFVFARQRETGTSRCESADSEFVFGIVFAGPGMSEDDLLLREYVVWSRCSMSVYCGGQSPPRSKTASNAALFTFVPSVGRKSVIRKSDAGSQCGRGIRFGLADCKPVLKVLPPKRRPAIDYTGIRGCRIQLVILFRKFELVEQSTSRYSHRRHWLGEMRAARRAA
jgi:hypothetical protein